MYLTEKTELETMLNASRVAIWKFDLRVCQMIFSQSVHKIFETPVNYEIDYSNFLLYFCSERSRGRLIYLLQSVLEDEKGFSEEFRVFTSNNAEKWIRVSAQPVLFEKKLLKITGTIVDVTEYFNYFPVDSFFFDVTDDLVWSLSENATLVNGNKAFRIYFENNLNWPVNLGNNFFSSNEMSNIHVNRFVEQLKIFFHRAKQGEVITEQVHTQLSNELNEIWFDLDVKLIEGRKNTRKVVFVLKDISLKKRLEKSQKVLTEKLLKVNFELDKFVYAVSHDLRSPILAVSGLIDLLSEKLEIINANEDCKNIILFMKKSLGRIDGTVQNILHYSRNIHKEPESELINIHGLVHASIENYLNYTKDGNKTIKFTTKIETRTPFYSDKYRVSTVLANLISNAIRYQRLGVPLQLVEISFTSEINQAVLIISDNGEGIRDSIMPFIFDMFFRGSANSEGSGLGLYIVKEMIKTLNGTIRVYKNEPYGTKVEVKIPNLMKKETNDYLAD